MASTTATKETAFLLGLASIWGALAAMSIAPLSPLQRLIDARWSNYEQIRLLLAVTTVGMAARGAKRFISAHGGA